MTDLSHTTESNSKQTLQKCKLSIACLFAQNTAEAQAPSATLPCSAQRSKVTRTPVKAPQELPAESAAKATGTVPPTLALTAC